MSREHPDLEAIFTSAIEIESPEERRGFLDRACDGDQELRSQVERLLRAHGGAGGFLESPAVQLAPKIDVPVAESPGTSIGPYTVLEEIGEGGFGVVYLAEQAEPVRRRVALKVIKPGMDSRQVVARFEAERQALALMNHPNVARVLDGGTTGSGRPYFVMDLIKGVPITEYCDHSSLPMRQRLELFLDVCQGIEHAHQKGIIHRDVKPSNVMVTAQGSKSVPKVIDFGVAKAIHDRLTDRTLQTRHTQMIGTPLYMSPEQAAVSGLDVDTRSDIYSLGVLLYELLTGTTPLELGQIGEASHDEIRRAIREEQPRTPSQRLASTEDAALTTIASRRRIDARRLPQLLSGDLDWIVMRALEKDRDRRYETASAFAADVERYLADEPVEARPPSAWYRFGKFARRNRAALWIAACALVAMTAVVGSVGWLVGERAARHGEAERQARTSLLDAEAAISLNDWPEARLALTRAEGLVVREGSSLEIATRIALLKRDLDMATRLEEIETEIGNSHSRSGLDAVAAARYAAAFEEYGLPVEALTVGEAAARIQGGRIALELAAGLERWAASVRVLEDSERWRHILSIARGTDPDPLRNRVRELWAEENETALEELALTAEIDGLPSFSARVIARALVNTGALEQAAIFLERAQRRHPQDFWLNRDLAHTLHNLDRWDEALRFATAAVALRPESVLARLDLATAFSGKGLLHDALAQSREAVRLDPDDSAVRSDLGCALEAAGLLDEAIAEHEKAIRLDPDNAMAHSNLGISLWKTKRDEEAIAEYHEAIRLDSAFALAHMNLGIALTRKGQLDDALAAHREAVRLQPRLALARINLGRTLEKMGLREQAIAEYREATRLRPRDVQAHGQLGIALARSRRVDEAIETFRTFVRLGPDNADAHYCLGNALSDKGLLDEAIGEYRTAVRLDPDNPRARYNLGASLARSGELDEAIGEYREAVRLDPLYAKAHANLGAALADKGLLDEAIFEQREAVKLAPDFAPLRNNLAISLGKKGLLDEAIEELGRAIRLDPRVASTHGNLGNALKEKGKLDEAIAAYREASRLEPDWACYYQSLGQLLLEKGDSDAAITALEKSVRLKPVHDDHFVDLDRAYTAAIESSPDDPRILLALARLLTTGPREKLRDPARAIGLARKAVALAPRDREAWNTLGVCEYRSGNQNEAIAALEKSIELGAGGTGFDYFFLAMAHRRLGNEREAREDHDRALRWMEENEPENEELLRFRAEAEHLLGSELEAPGIETTDPGRPATSKN